MTRPKIKLTLIDKKGPCGCHRGHRVGDTFDYVSTEGTMYMTFTGTLIGVFCEEGDAVFNLPLGFHG